MRPKTRPTRPGALAKHPANHEVSLDVEHGRALEARLALDHVGHGQAGEELAEVGASLGPDRLGALGGVAAGGGREAPVDRLDDVEDRDLGRRPPERVAALDAPLALQDPRPPEAGEELLEEVERDAPCLGDLEDRDRRRRSALSQLGQREDGGAALLRDRDQGDSVNLVGFRSLADPPGGPRAGPHSSMSSGFRYPSRLTRGASPSPRRSRSWKKRCSVSIQASRSPTMNS
jgi:hypothetical protein